MHLPQTPDYNLRWIVIISGMSILLLSFVVIGILDGL